MRTQILVSLIFLAVMISCKKAETTDAVFTPENEASVAEITGKGCYEFIKGKDTVTLSLVQNSNNVNGELDYHWAEKDRNRGTISGIFIGDTLFADYTFMSEGLTSVREIAFVKKGNSLVEGFGDVVEKDRKQVFTNPKKLNFDGGILLIKTDCN